MDPLIGYVNTTVGSDTANVSDGSNLLTGGIQQIDYSTDASAPNAVYSNPEVPYPVTPASYSGSGSASSSGSSDTISQIFIYNDPRAALEALSALGL